MMPERIELPGSFRLEKRNDGTYALFGKGSDWQVGCIGVEAITDFAAAMTRPAPERHNELREAITALGLVKLYFERLNKEQPVQDLAPHINSFFAERYPQLAALA